MNDLLWVVRFGPSFSPPQESHDRDAVEGPSHIQDEISRGELAGLQPGPRSTWRCDGVGVLGGDRRLDRCFRHQLLLPRPYLVLTKPLRLDIQCQRGASVKIGWKYLDD